MVIAGDKGRVAPTSSVHGALAGTGSQLFFALSAIYAALVLILWVAIYRLQPGAALPPVLWHAHEMLFGVAAAGLAGLACRLAPSGTPALGLRVVAPALIWLLGRVAMAAVGIVPSWLAALIDLAFIPVFAATVTIPGFAASRARSLAMVGLLGGLWVADLAMHAEAIGADREFADWGARFAVHLYLLPIAVVGGAAIPALTTRALRDAGSAAAVMPAPSLDVVAVAALGLYVAIDAIFGSGPAAAVAALAAAAFNALRLVRWKGYCVPRAPSVWILHLACLWLVLGLLLAAAEPMAGAVADMAAIHVMTAGAVGSGLIGMIWRDRPGADRPMPAAGAAITAACALVTLSAALRVMALFVPGGFADLVLASAVAWAAGFIVFAAAYLPGLTLSQRSPLDLDQGAEGEARR